ncbi:hypothetical protein Tco_0944082 [Tanacetum coccineum]
MLAICNAYEPMAFKAPKTSSKTKKNDPKGKKPIAKSGHRKQLPVSKNHPLSKIEVTKSMSLSKEATASQDGHSKKRKKSGTAKDTNPSQPQSSTPVVAGMHKEVQQATSGPASLGVTGEEGADPQLSNMKSASHSEPIFSASTIDLLSEQQGNDEGSQNYSFDHIIAGTNPNILVDKTQSAGDELDIVHTKTGTKKVASNDQEFNTYPELTICEDANEEIKLEDMSKLVKDVGIETMDLDALEDDQPFIELSNQVLLLQSQTIKLKNEKAAAEVEAAFLKLTKLLVNSLRPELSKLITNHDFTAIIPTELKDLPSKISDINKAVAKLKNLKLELPAKLLALPKQVSSINAQLSKLKVLDDITSLLKKVTEALYRFAQAIESA